MEYELIDFSVELEGTEATDTSRLVRDDSEIHYNAPIEYDEQGIPKGTTIEEIRIRQQIIKQFWSTWRAQHPEQRIYNEKLKEYILLRSVSLIEAKEHSAKSYLSTLAILQMDEILSKASPVGRTPAKSGNSNQSEFAEMLIMVYRREDLGTIKITIGVRHKTVKDAPQQKVQYGMSALSPGQSLMPPRENAKEKASHHK